MKLQKHFAVSLRNKSVLRAVKNGSKTRCVSSISAALQRKWHALSVAPHELRLDVTLTNGQCFGWKKYPPRISPKVKKESKVKKQPKKQKVKKRPEAKVTEKATTAIPTHNGGCFYGVIGSYVFLLKQTPTDTHYQVLNEDSLSKNPQQKERIESVLHDYFQLETNLKDLYSTWQASGDKRFAQISAALPGMRILRQDPVECMFSFICSSNNNISRIILMLDRLRERYGDMLWTDADLGITCYSFPPVERLAKATEQELRELGLGYRAPWIREAAISLHQMSTDESPHASGLDFLLNLRTLEQQAVQDALISYKGIGRKVADCVALFSLDQPACIPVDTHVWRIACRDFDPSLKSAKSLTPTVYQRVGDLFRRAFGPYAGWAHSVLFAAELSAFASRLPASIVADMQDFRQQEKLAKEAKKRDRERKKKNMPSNKKRSAPKVAGSNKRKRRSKTTTAKAKRKKTDS